MKRLTERTFEKFAFGIIVLALGIAEVIVRAVPDTELRWLYGLVAAVVLLVAALYERTRGWGLTIWTWVFIVLFAIVFILALVESARNTIGVYFLPITLLLAGLYFVIDAFTKEEA